MYESTYEGKRAFVEERLKPLIMDMDNAVINVFYNKAPGIESVIIQNKNPEKNCEANVAGDSITALVYDVMRVYYKTYQY